MRLHTSHVGFQRKDLLSISSRSGPHSNILHYKVVTALSGTQTRLSNHYSVCKSPPFSTFLFLYICKWWCQFLSPPPARETKLSSGDINRACYSCCSRKKRRREKGVAIFRNQNSFWLDFWLIGKCVYPEMHYPWLLNVCLKKKKKRPRYGTMFPTQIASRNICPVLQEALGQILIFPLGSQQQLPAAALTAQNRILNTQRAASSSRHSPFLFLQCGLSHETTCMVLNTWKIDLSVKVIN